MIDLENRFEQCVLKRREEALFGLPPVEEIRPPLKRPEIVEQKITNLPFRLTKNGRKRPKSLKEDILFNMVMTSVYMYIYIYIFRFFSKTIPHFRVRVTYLSCSE